MAKYYIYIERWELFCGRGEVEADSHKEAVAKARADALKLQGTFNYECDSTTKPKVRSIKATKIRSDNQ